MHFAWSLCDWIDWNCQIDISACDRGWCENDSFNEIIRAKLTSLKKIEIWK